MNQVGNQSGNGRHVAGDVTPLADRSRPGDRQGVDGAEERSAGRVVAGRYRLESVLGRGGMGVVWLAVDTLIGRRVALKELRAPTGVAEGDEDSFVERSLREARNAGRLNHPGVVAVHDVIAPSGGDDAVYIVMEYVQAPTLAEVLDQQGALPPHRVATMGLGILDAVMAAHTMGIVHRDIKPANVLVRDGDRVKLTDFGIALAADDTRLTRSGVLGTHAYLAPECFDKGQAGPAADLWALGATLFHAVAGQAPFDRDTTTATLRAILFEDVPAPPCEPRLAEVITGLLTRPIQERLTSDVARHLLEPIAAEADSTASTVDAPSAGGDGQAGWEAQATSLHRPPATTPPPQAAPPQPWGQTPQPWGPPAGQTTQPATPSPYVTAQPAQPTAPSPGPGGPAGSTYSGSGWGTSPQAPATTGPTYGSSWTGSSPQRNNNTPWIIGGAIAAAAIVLLFVVLASGGGSGGSTSSPDGAVRGMLEAVLDGDCERAADYVTANFDDVCPENPEDVGLATLGSVETVSQSGSSAVVRATIADGDGSETSIPFDVVRVDGDWKVDDINFDEMDLPEPDLPPEVTIPEPDIPSG